MTREDYFVRKTKLLAQIHSAKKLDCMDVFKCAKKELAKLEKKYKKEHFSNKLFSYMTTDEESSELLAKNAKPTFLVHIDFKAGDSCDMIFFHEIAPGAKHSAIAKWAEDILAKHIQHPENIKSSRFIIG